MSSVVERAMAAATDDERLAVGHLPVRRQERKKERGRKETIAISFCHPLSTFAEIPSAENEISAATMSMQY